MPENLYKSLSRERHDQAMRYYRAQNAIWLWLALATWITAINWWEDPARAAVKSAVGRKLANPLDDIWVTGMAIGGTLIAYGIWRFSIRVEIIGQMFVCICVLINFAAVASIFGITSTALIIGAVAAASGGRIWFLWRAAKGASF